MGAKKLSDLRVVDLREELEKRGLDTKGNKALLIERLTTALEREGVSPDNFVGAEMDSSTEKTQDSVTDVVADAGEAEETSNQSKSETIAADEETAVVETENVQVDAANLEETTSENLDDSCTAENDDTTNAAADDDELHLTIGDDEEDKFMIDGDENKKDNPATENNYEESKRNDSAANISLVECSVLSEVQSSGSGKIETRSENSDVKSYEKSEEGKPHRKSRDDDRNTLLVTGLSSQTAATEIKAVFKKHGKIGGVKIMSNAKDPEGSRFALVAVMSSEDATTCIKNLDGFELHGRIIHVDQARAEMLSAEWVKKESNRESSKSKKESSKKAINGHSSSSSRNNSAKGADKPSTSSTKAKATSLDKSDQHKKSTSEILKKNDSATVSNKIKGADGGVEDKKKDQPTASVKKDVVKAAATSSKPSEQRKSSTDKRDVKKDVIPMTHFNRRQNGPSYRGRTIRDYGPGRSRYEDREVHHRREEYLRDRRHYPERDGHSYHPVRRSPPARVPVHRAPPTDVRRIGRQPELTFEDIYHARQREKDRELERERREAEKRRIEEEQRQRLLDEEFRRLAKERERIEAEKAELKRQKEKMIMEEREKQRIEQAELEREKALLLRKAKAKRMHAEESYCRIEPKKPVLDDRSRHAVPYDTSIRSEKDKIRSLPSYRRDEHSRYPIDGTATRGGPPLRSAPVRDRRSPSWEKDRMRNRVVRDTDRHATREREAVKVPRGERRDEHKQFAQSSTTASDASGGRYSYDNPASHYSSSSTLPTAIHGRNMTTSSKVMDSYYPGGRDSRLPSSTYPSDTGLVGMKTDSWPSSREPAWGSDRIVSRPVTEMPDRWVSSSSMGTTGSRIAIPVAPPPPIFSNPAEEMTLSMPPSSFNSGLYNNGYEYKLPPFSSHRR